ncbi:pentapeptide repeat-containing protein [Streptomyces sp. NPDC101166]|uniref:pentapeptide repeat-containing protein n=1 Tax=Streptomyces sp. NPDC101166 TaxID=3366120 RepID=UPI0037FAA407
MRPNLSRRRGLRLWPVGPVLSLTFLTALAVAGAVFFTVWDLLGVHGLKSEPRIDSGTLFDLVKLSFGVVGGAGALVALVVAYRRQRVDEDAALRESTRLHTERFTTAVSQLGEESAAVRLGGVHALAGLADDAPTRDLRQTCIDVLCAYLRLPYMAEIDLPANDPQSWHDYLALREVRHTIIRLTRDHLRLPRDHPRSWQGHDFDFSNVVFDGGDWTRAQFSGGHVSFAGAHFSGGDVEFSGAQFSGGQVDFGDALFSGGRVRFVMAEFSGGEIIFEETQFSGGQISFIGAQFSGSGVFFITTEFSGAEVSFNTATFESGEVIFVADLSGGKVDFSRAHFVGAQVSFEGSDFSGCLIDLEDAVGNVPEGLPVVNGNSVS